MNLPGGSGRAAGSPVLSQQLLSPHTFDRRYGEHQARRHRQAVEEHRMLTSVLNVTAVLLWVPYFLAALYVAYCDSFVKEHSSVGMGEGSSQWSSGAGQTPSSSFSSLLDSSTTATVTVGVWELQHSYPWWYYVFFSYGFDVTVFVQRATPVVLFSCSLIYLSTILSKRQKDQTVWWVALAWLAGGVSHSWWGTDAVMQTRSAVFFTQQQQRQGSESLSTGGTPLASTSSNGSSGATGSSLLSGLSSPLSSNLSSYFSPSSPSGSASRLFFSAPLPDPFAVEAFWHHPNYSVSPSSLSAAWNTTAVNHSYGVASPHISAAAAQQHAAAFASYPFLRLEDRRIPTPSPWLWLLVSVATGVLAGIACRARDRLDGEQRRCDESCGAVFYTYDTYEEEVSQSYFSPPTSPPASPPPSASSAGHFPSMSSAPSSPSSAAHQQPCLHLFSGPSGEPQGATKYQGMRLHLSLVGPFCIGQWFSLMLRYGWRGFLVQNIVAVVTLGFLGYTTVVFKLLRRHVRRSVVVQKVSEQRVSQANPATGPCSPVGSVGSAGVQVSGRGASIASSSVCAAGGVDAFGTPVRRASQLAAAAASVVVETNAAKVDYLRVVYRLFATKLGIIAFMMILMHVYVSSWMLSMIRTLYTLNALVSGAGILVELLVYEVL